jgi:hypothetical protein
MNRSTAVAVLWSALAWPAVADAAWERPAWLDRAEQSVALLKVPARPDVNEERIGTGLVVGVREGVLHLITAAHVIWPYTIPNSSDKVTVEVELASVCSAPMPGSASPERAIPKNRLDLAVVTVTLDQVSASACPGLADRVRELPKHLVDPAGESLRGGAQAWIIGRGERGGLDVLNPTLKAQVTEQIQLVRIEGVKPGQSGAPLFSDRGHLIGMIVTDAADSAAKSYRSILNQLVLWGDVPVELAGEYTNLTFQQELKRALVSVAGRPLEPLASPHPSPRAKGST